MSACVFRLVAPTISRQVHVHVDVRRQAFSFAPALDSLRNILTVSIVHSIESMASIPTLCASYSRQLSARRFSFHGEKSAVSARLPRLPSLPSSILQYVIALHAASRQRGVMHARHNRGPLRQLVSRRPAPLQVVS